MKKFLSMVLALVMAMSLVTVSAGAKEFKDLAASDYQEAIDVISELGIVGGVTADTFEPKSTLTRGAATKFVANLMLGPDLAAKLPDSTSFTDVPSGSTFAKYAGYLKSQGVIGGYGDGSFGVKNGLTGDAFLKMVLGALGYDAATEGYGVDGWQVNVALDAIAAGLVDGLKNFDSSKVITREQAAQIVLNALEADTVYYENKSSISIGNVVINNSSEAKKVTTTATDYAGRADTNLQLVEKLFAGVTKEEGTIDAMGRPAVEWFDADDESMSLTAEKPAVVYSTFKTYGTVYKDLGLKANTPFVRWINGVGGTTKTGDIANTSSNIQSANNGQGSTFEVYYDKDAGIPIKILQINEYIAKVTGVTAATSTAARKVTLEVLSGAKTPVTGTTTFTFETEEFAKNDIVYFTYSEKDSKVVSAGIADTKTGVYNKLLGTTAPYIDGVQVTAATPCARWFSVNTGAADSTKVSFGDTIKAYLNSNGFYLYIEKVSATTVQDKYAYVLASTKIDGEADWATGKEAADTFKAQLLFIDGTTAIVETEANAADLVNDFVIYGVNTKGQYKLTDATEGDTTAAAAVATSKTSITATVNGASVNVNNATTYIVKTLDANDEPVYTLYGGYKAAPKMSGTALSDSVTKENAKAAAYIFVDASDDAFDIDNDTANKDIIVIGKSGGTTKFSDKDSVWYNATALVNGEKKAITIAEAAYAAVDGTFELYTKYTIDDNGHYVVADADEKAADYSGTEAGKVGVAYTDGLLTLGATNFAMADDVVIVYATSSSALSFWTVDQLAAYKDITSSSNDAANDFVWAFQNADDQVEYLIILKK